MSNASLKTMAEGKTGGVAKVTIFRVDPNKITFEEGFNLREAGKDLDQHIEHLYEAMKAGAFVPPVDVSVVDGQIIARDGHCRTKAAQKLRSEVPDYTLEVRQFRGNDADAVLHMLGTGSGGKPLSPLEQGKGYLRLIKFGLTATEIAKKLGVSRPTVDNGITLAEAPVELQKMITTGETSATTVRDAIKSGPEAVKALKTAVKERREAPQPSTGGKPPAKKKVTAKTLRGTPAEKKSKKKTEDPAPTPEPNTPADSVTVTLKRSDAAAVEKFLRDFMGEDSPDLKAVADALETALL